jgi:DNA polymerase III epsilon subunit-like protein
MKILWFDLETTGLSPIKNDIVSLACLLEIDGYIQDTLYLEMQPVNWDTISPEALKINGYTHERLKTFMAPEVVWSNLWPRK